MRAVRTTFVGLLLLASACTSSGSSTADGTSGPAGSTVTTPGSGEHAGAPKQAPAEDESASGENLPPTGCTGNPGELYELAPKRLGTIETDPMCRYRGSVILVVNTASHCGYTPQYGALEQIYEKYQLEHFYVLGFPSNSFNQEDTNEATISTFCTTTYNITFPMHAIGDVNGVNTQPVYVWLKSQPDMSADVAWNFEKFLVGKTGKVAARFLTGVTPDDPQVIAAIEAELAK